MWLNGQNKEMAERWPQRAEPARNHQNPQNAQDLLWLHAPCLEPRCPGSAVHAISSAMPATAGRFNLVAFKMSVALVMASSSSSRMACKLHQVVRCDDLIKAAGCISPCAVRRLPLSPGRTWLSGAYLWTTQMKGFLTWSLQRTSVSLTYFLSSWQNHKWFVKMRQ